MSPRVLRPCWLPLIFVGLLHGQAELAIVRGVVTESASRVIAGVSVTVRNTDTDATHRVTSNPEGYFAVPELPAGPYVIEAVSPGFERYRETGIVLDVGQTFSTEIKMVVGSVMDSIDVKADVANLNTDNGMVKGYVVTQGEISEMPLNGRDFTELALFVPGVIASPAGEPGSFAAINGARSDSTNFMVDGIDDRNVRGANVQLRPNIDSMQEFKMETSGFSAEYGKMAGGILNMVLKTGTNAYHGLVFEYIRNDIFDAKAYFDTARLPFKQNQFGGLISGPVSIPKIYNGHDRTFFMFSWESLFNPYGESYLGTVPTALQHAGNFSGAVNNTGAATVIKNPFNNYAPFPGNIIPPNLIDPIAEKILRYYPLPNRAAVGNNHVSAVHRYNNFNSFITRGDHRVNDKNSISITYGKRYAWSNNPASGSNLGVFGFTARDDRELGGISFTHIFTPTLILESRFGMSRSATRDSLPGSFPTAAQLGMAGSTTGLAGFPAAFPTFNVTGYLTLGYPNNEPVQYFVTNYGVHETLTSIKGAHILKMGADISRNRLNQPYFNNARGTVTASGIWTGNGTASSGDAVADLELGLVATSSITTQTQNNYMRNAEYAFFFTDDWKIRRDLTLNLGVRYEIDGPPSDLYGRVTNFIPQYGQVVVGNPANIPNYAQSVASTATGALTVPASKYGIPQSLIYTNYKGFAPRVGFAWRVLGGSKTVLRGGYGIFYTGGQLNNIRNGLDNVFPAVIAPSFSRVATDTSALTLANPWPGGLATLGTTASGYPLHPPNSYLQSYNLTVERELNRYLVFEAAFVGSKGTHLSIEDNINTPYRTIASYQATGTFVSPYGSTFGTINEWCLCTNSIYNAGQFTFRNRSAGGLTYHVSYSYSKSLDVASGADGNSGTLGGNIEDPRNLRLSRGRSDFDHGHVVQAVISYPLPMGRNKKFLDGMGRVADGFLGGWVLAGTSLFETGSPLTVEDSSVNTAIGQSLYPNRIANGADTTGAGRRGIDYPWYNPAAFQRVPGCASRTDCSPDKYGFLPFALGNAGRNILDAPGLANINMSLQKNWVVGDRKNVQFRWEVFNILNHPNFVLLDRNFNEAAAGYLTSVASVGTGGARIMQFGLKYSF